MAFWLVTEKLEKEGLHVSFASDSSLNKWIQAESENKSLMGST